VIVAAKVAFWLARMLAMSPIAGLGTREGLIHFRLPYDTRPWVVRDSPRRRATLGTNEKWAVGSLVGPASEFLVETTLAPTCLASASGNRVCVFKYVC